MEQARDVAELMRKKKAIVDEKQTDTQTKSGDEERRWVNLCRKYTGQKLLFFGTQLISMLI